MKRKKQKNTNNAPKGIILATKGFNISNNCFWEKNLIIFN